MDSLVNKRPRVLFVMRSVSHFTYHQSTLESLLKLGAIVQIAIDQKWSKQRSTTFIEKWVSEKSVAPFDWAPLRTGRLRNLVFALREIRTYASYLRRPEQSVFYLNRWGGYLPKPLLRLLGRPLIGRAIRVFLRSPIADPLFRLIENLVPPDRAILDYVRKQNPDVVISSPVNMRYSEEVEYFKAAKKLGTPTVLPVYSWDNLTTKGLIHVIPDLLLAWNDAHKEEAQSIHKVPAERIALSGSPFFDKWFDQPEPTAEERSAYLKKVGLDPKRPVVTYLGSSTNIARDETWIVESIGAALASSPDSYLRSVQLLVRPHPSNFGVYQKSFPEGVSVWPRPPFDFEMGVPETHSALRDFYLALSVCEATLGINTSAMLESVIADKPTGCFFTERYRATQEQAVHFQQLWNSNALDVLSSENEFLSWLLRLHAREDARKGDRRAFVAKFVRPRGLDRNAGWEQARAAMQIALGTTQEVVMLDKESIHVRS